ncbi:MAG: hypothetical protein E8D52_17850 [Nitrospira sp.]|nr:MAG: hypothetical protein E8D52_17850 [Nitrospira sp.]
MRTFALAVIAGACFACSMGFAEQPVLRSSQSRIAMTGQSLLVGDRPETPGYGLHSYVLFKQEPTDENRPLYLAIILACLKGVPDLGRLEEKYHDKQMLNALWIPVTEDVTDSAVPSPELPENEQFKSRAKEILKRYNYPRAKAILNRLSTIQRNDGPYLASGFEPALHGNTPRLFLFQDLSAVRLVSSQADQTELAFAWVLHFISRVSDPRSKSWDSDALTTFSDKLRRNIQPAFEKYGVRADQLDLKKYIVFPPPDDGRQRTLLVPSWVAQGNDSSPSPIPILERSHFEPM